MLSLVGVHASCVRLEKGGSMFVMKVAWLRQCVYELKQENEQLKTELAAIKAKLGM